MAAKKKTVKEKAKEMVEAAKAKIGLGIKEEAKEEETVEDKPGVIDETPEGFGVEETATVVDEPATEEVAVEEEATSSPKVISEDADPAQSIQSNVVDKQMRDFKARPVKEGNKYGLTIYAGNGEPIATVTDLKPSKKKAVEYGIQLFKKSLSWSIYEDKAGKYRFRFWDRSTDGDDIVIASSQGYVNKSHCGRMAKRIHAGPVIVEG